MTGAEAEAADGTRQLSGGADWVNCARRSVARERVAGREREGLGIREDGMGFDLGRVRAAGHAGRGGAGRAR